MVYDCTNRQTFTSITNWLKQLNQNTDQFVHKVLVANKIDRESEMVVTKEEGETLAKEHGLAFFAASAKSGEGVDEMFTACCERAIKQQVLRDEAKVQADQNLQLGATHNADGSKTQLHPKYYSCC